jgi:hypothetical protein
VPQWDYITMLLLVAGLSLLRRSSWRAGLALIGAWVATEIAVKVTGRYDPWYCFAAINIAAAWAVLRPPSNRLGSLIGATLIWQLLVDVGYGLAGNPDVMMQYLIRQTDMAWGQLAILGLWYVGGCIRYFVRKGRPSTIVRRDPGVASGG